MKQKIKQKALVTENIHPEVVAAQHGWWFTEQLAPDHGIFESNINVIMTDEVECDPICGAVPIRAHYADCVKWQKQFKLAQVLSMTLSPDDGGG